jgi:hypothetical protein
MIGGFFGLFAGFSVLSGFELVFGFSLEPLVGWARRTDTRVHPMIDERRPKMTFMGFIRSFFDSSSVHGLNQFGNDQKSIVERCVKGKNDTE